MNTTKGVLYSSPCDSDNQLAGSEHSRIDGEPTAILGARSRSTGQRGGHSQKGNGSAQEADRQGLEYVIPKGIDEVRK